VNSARSSAVTRHTFGSRLIQQGESLAYVKEQMGHASIQSPIKQSKHSSDSKC
jgi:Site-specific recombinase XerD